MSVKRFCDRCGREIKTGDEWSRLNVYDGECYDSRRFHLSEHDQEELCMGCRVSLEEWFKAGSDAK